MAKEEEVGERHEWGALATCRQVSSAKVGDDLAFRFVRQERGIEPLDGIGWLVKQCLSVGGDGGDVAGVQLCQSERFIDRGGGDERDLPAHLRKSAQNLGFHFIVAEGEDLAA